MAAALCQLETLGMEPVAAHEAALTEYSLRKLSSVPGFQVYGDSDPDRTTARLGVLPFNIEGLSHFLVAAILGHEFGIGVRNGCFCAHPYILHLLALTSEERHLVRNNILAENKQEMPGLVRVSFGLYNTPEEVDEFVEALNCIVRGKYTGQYQQDAASGEFHPVGWQPDFKKFFSF